MADPIDKFFGIEREHLPVVADNPEPAGKLEEAAIAEDVQLVREKLRQGIQEASEKIPGVLDLAMQMQIPEMVDSAAKMLTALSKLSTDLINIDLRVLQESKKTSRDVQVKTTEDVGGENRVVTEATAAEILNIIAKNKTKNATD